MRRVVGAAQGNAPVADLHEHRRTRVGGEPSGWTGQAVGAVIELDGLDAVARAFDLEGRRDRAPVQKQEIRISIEIPRRGRAGSDQGPPRGAFEQRWNVHPPLVVEIREPRVAGQRFDDPSLRVGSEREIGECEHTSELAHLHGMCTERDSGGALYGVGAGEWSSQRIPNYSRTAAATVPTTAITTVTNFHVSARNSCVMSSNLDSSRSNRTSTAAKRRSTISN